MIRNISYKKRRNSRALAKIFEKSTVLLYTTYYDSGGVSFKVSAKYTNKDGFTMALLETWRNLAYGDGLDDKKREELWSGYFQIEKGIYEQILSQPEQVITGTVKELAFISYLILFLFADNILSSLFIYQSEHNPEASV